MRIRFTFDWIIHYKLGPFQFLNLDQSKLTSILFIWFMVPQNWWSDIVPTTTALFDVWHIYIYIYDRVRTVLTESQWKFFCGPTKGSILELDGWRLKELYMSHASNPFIYGGKPNHPFVWVNNRSHKLQFIPIGAYDYEGVLQHYKVWVGLKVGPTYRPW